MVKDIKPPPTKKPRRCKNDKKQTTAASSTVTMEEGVWKEFPEDLFEPVIARLPVATIFRFRSVSREWNSLPSSKSFAKHFDEVSQTYPWFYSISHENLTTSSMYDPYLNKWHQPDPLLPSKIRLPMCSAGGLLCFLDIGSKNFSVLNPLTRSFRELPARPVRGWPRVVAGMTQNKNSVSGNGYKILWLACNGDHEFYDSDTEIWARPGNMPPSITIPLSLNTRSHSVSMNGILYFMRTRPDGIVSYDTKCGTWKQYVIPLPPHLTNCTLAESKGRIMLVGLESVNLLTCVRVWELQKMTLLWKEVDRMPINWCLDFYGKQTSMTCLGNEGTILISLMSRRMNRLVMCDLSSRKWKEVPWRQFPRRRRLQCFACGIAFFPSVTASP